MKVSSVFTSHTLAFCAGGDQLIESDISLFFSIHSSSTKLNVSVIAYWEELLLVCSTKEEYLSNPRQDDGTVSQVKLRKDFKGKLIAFKNADIPFRLYSKNKQAPLSVPIAIKLRLGSIIRHPSRCQVRDLKLVYTDNSMKWQRDKKEVNQHMVIPVVCDSIKHVIESSRDALSINVKPCSYTWLSSISILNFVSYVTSLLHKNSFVMLSDWGPSGIDIGNGFYTDLKFGST
ncbi:hypothetical protein ACTFIU_011156 [Dictyostelium citrinum]